MAFCVARHHWCLWQRSSHVRSIHILYHGFFHLIVACILQLFPHGADGVCKSPVAIGYLAKRELKDDDDSKRLAEQIKSSLGNRKKGRKLAEYYEQLEIESNTQLVEGLIRQK